MAEISRPWDGIVLGDAGPYSDDQWTDVWLTLNSPTIASEGVLRDQLNDLNLSGLPASPVTIETGRAVVDGSWYQSDANVGVTIPTPAANPRVDRIVLRKDWVLQTIRITRIAGAEAASPTPPAIVQVDGTTWDLPLWQVHITVGAVVTVFADEREFIGQYNPVGVSATRVFVESDLFTREVLANLDMFDNFVVDLIGASTANQIAEAGFGSGGLVFDHDGAGINDKAAISSAYFKPDLIDARLRVRNKTPNTDGNLDMVMGFVSQKTSLTPVDGVFFRSNGGANWFAVTRAGNVETTTDTAQAADDTWRLFEIRQTSTDVVQFLIDGVIVATHQTNIPSDVVLILNLAAFDNGVAPAAADYMHLDWAKVTGDRP